MENTSEVKKTLFDNALLITILPGDLYLAAYLYQKSVFDYYKIPTEFISVSLNSVLVLSGLFFLTFSLFVFSLFYLTMIIEEFTKIRLSKKHFVLISLSMILVFLITLIIGLLKPDLSIVFCFTSSLLFQLLIIIIMIWIKKIKLKRQHQTPETTIQSRRSFGQLYINGLKNDFSLIVIVIYFLMPVISIVVGDFNVSRKRSYLTAAGNKKILILNKADDYLFCRHFDEKTNLASDSLIILKLPETGSMVFGRVEKNINFEKLH